MDSAGFSKCCRGARVHGVDGQAYLWAQLLAWSLLVSIVWSLLTPPVYELGRRFTFDRNRWKKSLPIHLAASIAITFLSAAIVVELDPLVTWTNDEPQVPIRAHMLSRVLMDLQRYWYIVLITQAIAYYGKYRERELLSSQLEAQLANAQLEVLKIQLEPHFLFNTLNSIAALARNDGPAAEHMTLQLADLLRCSLDAVGVHEVTLQQELTVPAEVHRHSADTLPGPPAGGNGRRSRCARRFGAKPDSAAAGGERNSSRHWSAPRPRIDSPIGVARSR